MTDDAARDILEHSDEYAALSIPLEACGCSPDVISEVRWRGGELHRDAEPPSGPGGEGQGSLVCLDDALDDCQAEAYACVVGAYAFAASLKRLGKRGSQLWGELLAGVLDGEHHARGVSAGRDPYGAPFRQVVDDRVVHEVRSHLEQERG